MGEQHHPFPFFWYNISTIKHPPNTFIVIEVELPFKCSIDIFNKAYKELYKNQITHEFIRNQLGLSDSVRLKLNGTFKRRLYLLDKDNCTYCVTYEIQTALWLNSTTGKWQYVSIFPSFIKRYCQPCLHMLEYISCHTGKGENIYRHIDDPEALFDCEDFFTRSIKCIEKECEQAKYAALLNSRYADVYNRPLSINDTEFKSGRRFSVLYTLVLTARKFYGVQQGVLALANTILHL